MIATTDLDFLEQKKLLSRILNGYYTIKINKYNLRVYPPSIDIENKANIYHNNILEDIKYDDEDCWLREDKRMMILSQLGIWYPDKQKEIDTILKDIDKLKIELFKHYSLKDTRKLIKEKLTQLQNEINILHYQKYTFFEYTKESFAYNLKNQYIIKHTVYLKDKLFFSKERLNNLFYLNKANGLLKELTFQEVRSLVHDEDWKSMWEPAKNKVFNKPIIKCNKEQKMLINTSIMIDQIRQHPKCPSEEILKDSDALDGWILYQNQEQEKEKRKQEIESSITDKNAGEVFVMATSPDDIKAVMSMNDPQTRQDIRSMHKYVESQDKPTNWHEVPSIRQKILREHKVQ